MLCGLAGLKAALYLVAHACTLATGCHWVVWRGDDGAQVVQQSFFGVGAPEALLVGVVALVVFGPKGLAEVGGPRRTCPAGTPLAGPGARASPPPKGAPFGPFACMHCMAPARLRLVDAWILCARPHTCRLLAPLRERATPGIHACATEGRLAAGPVRIRHWPGCRCGEARCLQRVGCTAPVPYGVVCSHADRSAECIDACGWVGVGAAEGSTHIYEGCKVRLCLPQRACCVARAGHEAGGGGEGVGTALHVNGQRGFAIINLEFSVALCVLLLDRRRGAWALRCAPSSRPSRRWCRCRRSSRGRWKRWAARHIWI